MQENNKNKNWIVILVIIIILVLGYISYSNKETFKKFFGFATVWNAFTYDTDGNLAVKNEWTTDSGSLAWSESSGWIDFAPVNGKIYVADNALWGYAYGENIGWISLNCGNTGTCSDVNYKVQNDGNGNLFGQAWGENIGWIDFGTSTGYEVKIDGTTGDFSGYAYGENIGWISFNSLNGGSIPYKVSTNWQSPSVRIKNQKKTTRKEVLEEQASSSNALLKQEQATTSNEISTSSNLTSTQKVLIPIKTVELPIAEIKPLILKTLPTFGGIEKTSFTFEPRINSFLFAPLPDSVLNYLNENNALKNYLTSIGLNTTQSIISLIRYPILMKPDSYLIPGIFNILSNNNQIRTYLINDSVGGLAEGIRISPNTPIIISVLPVDSGDIKGIWNNGKTTNFTLSGKSATAKVIINSAGKYIFKSSALPLPLIIDVLASSSAGNNQTASSNGISSWFSGLLERFNK